MAQSIFSSNDIRDFEYALGLQPLTVQDLHAIFYKAGMQKVKGTTYSKKQKTWLFHRIYEDYTLRYELRKYVLNYKQEKGEKIQDTDALYENKKKQHKTMKLTENKLRQIIREILNEVSLKHGGYAHNAH